MSCRHYYRLSRIFYCINHGINSLIKNSCSFLSTKKYDNNVAFPKNAENHNNNVASAHCVEISEGRKIVKGHKGLKPLVIRNLDAKKHDNNVAFPKNVENHNNNVAFPTGRLWRAHCVEISEGRKIVKAHKEFLAGMQNCKAHKGLKPLVICMDCHAFGSQ